MKRITLSLLLLGCSVTACAETLPVTTENRTIHFLDVTSSMNSQLSPQACKAVFTSANYQLTPKRKVIFSKDAVLQNFVSSTQMTLSPREELKDATAMAAFSWQGKMYHAITDIKYFVVRTGDKLNAYALWENKYCSGAYRSALMHTA